MRPEASEEPSPGWMLETQRLGMPTRERPHYMPLFVSPSRFLEPLADDRDVITP